MTYLWGRANFIYFGRLLSLHFKTNPSSMLSLMVMTSYTETMLMSVLLLALPRYHHYQMIVDLFQGLVVPVSFLFTVYLTVI